MKKVTVIQSQAFHSELIPRHASPNGMSSMSNCNGILIDELLSVTNCVSLLKKHNGTPVK